MNFSFENVFGDKQVSDKPTTGGTFQKMEPKVIKLEDGTFEIDGFVEDVKITEWKFDSEKSQLVITFSDDQNRTARKYISDPSTRQYILDKDEAKQAELSGYVLKEISNVASKFVYTQTIMKAVKDLGADFTFEQFVTTIGDLVMGDKNKTNQKVSLKLAFKNSSGTVFEFIIPNNSYIGTEEPYGPKWTKKEGGAYNDITNFELVEPTVDFSSSSNLDSIDDIFSTTTLNPGTLL